MEGTPVEDILVRGSLAEDKRLLVDTLFIIHNNTLINRSHENPESKVLKIKLVGINGIKQNRITLWRRNTNRRLLLVWIVVTHIDISFKRRKPEIRIKDLTMKEPREWSESFIKRIEGGERSRGYRQGSFLRLLNPVRKQLRVSRSILQRYWRCLLWDCY